MATPRKWPGRPAPQSPLSRAVLPVAATVGGLPAEIQYAGLAPGYVGLMQLNLRVPGFHTSGNPLPVTLKIGGVSSPTTAPVVPKTAVD